jgi:hypothetical protein
MNDKLIKEYMYGHKTFFFSWRKVEEYIEIEKYQGIELSELREAQRKVQGWTNFDEVIF